jgi:hypothetical protein
LEEAKAMGERSVSIGRDAIGSQIVTGDRNIVTQSGQRITLPAAESVDIQKELAELRAILATLKAPDAGKLGRALDDAEDEAKKDEPDKDEIGGSIERAVKYAKGASDFGEQVEKLAPKLAAVCSWLGENWLKLLPLAGLAF